MITVPIFLCVKTENPFQKQNNSARHLTERDELSGSMIHASTNRAGAPPHCPTLLLCMRVLLTPEQHSILGSLLNALLLDFT